MSKQINDILKSAFTKVSVSRYKLNKLELVRDRLENGMGFLTEAAHAHFAVESEVIAQSWFLNMEDRPIGFSETPHNYPLYAINVQQWDLIDGSGSWEPGIW